MFIALFIITTLCQTVYAAEQPVDEQIGPVYLPQLQSPGPKIVIAAAHIDSAISGEADEAIMLWNIGERTQDLAGWQISTATRHATIPVTVTLSLEPGAFIWCAADDTAFLHSFGHAPACAWDVAAASIGSEVAWRSLAH